MKSLGIALAVILALVIDAPAQNTQVLFPINTLFGGAAYNKPITITAMNTLLTDGQNLWAGTYTVIPASTTNPIASLYPNTYLLTVAGVVRATRFTVPASTNTLDVTGLITSGPLFYFGTNGMINLWPGPNITFVTNADGSITVSSTGGGFALGSSITGSNGATAVWMLGLDALGRQTSNAVPASGSSPSSNNFVGSLNVGQVYGAISGTAITNAANAAATNLTFIFSDALGNYSAGKYNAPPLVGTENAAFGSSSMTGLSNGSWNIFIGGAAAGSLTTGSQNAFVGGAAGVDLTNGWNNTVIGYDGLANTFNSTNNISIGQGAAGAYTNYESDNIDIGSAGVAGEHGAIHIGATGVQSNAYIAGVITANGGGLTNVFIANLVSNGLPVAPAAGQVATFTAAGTLVASNSAGGTTILGTPGNSTAPVYLSASNGPVWVNASSVFDDFINGGGSEVYGSSVHQNGGTATENAPTGYTTGRNGFFRFVLGPSNSATYATISYRQAEYTLWNQCYCSADVLFQTAITNLFVQIGIESQVYASGGVFGSNMTSGVAWELNASISPNFVARCGGSSTTTWTNASPVALNTWYRLSFWGNTNNMVFGINDIPVWTNSNSATLPGGIASENVQVVTGTCMTNPITGGANNIMFLDKFSFLDYQ